MANYASDSATDPETSSVSANTESERSDEEDELFDDDEDDEDDEENEEGEDSDEYVDKKVTEQFDREYKQAQRHTLVYRPAPSAPSVARLHNPGRRSQRQQTDVGLKYQEKQVKVTSASSKVELIYQILCDRNILTLKGKEQGQELVSKTKRHHSSPLGQASKGRKPAPFISQRLFPHSRRRPSLEAHRQETPESSRSLETVEGRNRQNDAFQPTQQQQHR